MVRGNAYVSEEGKFKNKLDVTKEEKKKKAGQEAKDKERKSEKEIRCGW